MKKSVLKIQIIFLALVAASLAGCDLFEKADDVSFTSTLDETFSVDETDEAQDKVYEKELVLDATSDPEIQKYKDKVKGFAVNKITYEVKNFVGNAATFTSASISFSDTDATNAEVIATIDNLDLAAASNNGTVYELAVDEAGTAKIQAFLKSDKAVKIYINGTLSQTPVSFDIKVTMNVKVEADVL